MRKLNDYLYSGDTVIKILKNYRNDLETDVSESGNVIDRKHAEFLMQISDLLEHNEFLTSQSQRIREFYKFMVEKYPYLAFTFKGRIKSVIRAEEKFNGYVLGQAETYYRSHGVFPDMEEVCKNIGVFRDLIAYRIVISVPRCHLTDGQNQEEEEIRILYEIANILPDFLKERGFAPQASRHSSDRTSEMLGKEAAPYYRDYVANTGATGYKSLHITMYDNLSGSYVEIQLRTKTMDDYAEIGPANHLGYEKRQKDERTSLKEIRLGACGYFDEAYERLTALHNLDLSKIDVNMFAASETGLINDGCGLYNGRLILPFEHLSRFQNDV